MSGRDVPTESESTQITQLIHQAMQGDAAAEALLTDRIFLRLQTLARSVLPNDQGSIQAGDLVNEVWMRTFRDVKPVLVSREAFFAYAARAMRNLLIDHIRRKRRLKAGGNMQRHALDGLVLQYESLARVEMMTLNDELEKLREEGERQFRTVELRFFGGLTMRQIAEFLGVSLATVENDWKLARAKLRLRIRGGETD